MLQRHWASADVTPLWQTRHGNAPSGHIVFDPLADPTHCASSCGPVDVVLGLAGVVPGQGDLRLNTVLGRAALDIGAAAGAKRVFLTSSAAVYGPSKTPLHEDTTLRPANAYGAAKCQMEQDARAHVATLPTQMTALRIGNVAGADALLAQPGATRILDRFTDGQGPRRSYIGPKALTEVLAHLMVLAADGRDLPDTLNISLPGTVTMEELCCAAGLQITWQPAPDTALPVVALDVARLQAHIPLPQADADAIIADWHADRALC